jgi:hypothetical protein
MSPDELKAKLETAGCCFTSAGVIAVDSQRLVLSYMEALQEIERLQNVEAKAATYERTRCAKLCDEAHELDERDNGAAATGAAAIAAAAIRGERVL